MANEVLSHRQFCRAISDPDGPYAPSARGACPACGDPAPAIRVGLHPRGPRKTYRSGSRTAPVVIRSTAMTQRIDAPIREIARTLHTLACLVAREPLDVETRSSIADLMQTEDAQRTTLLRALMDPDALLARTEREALGQLLQDLAWRLGFEAISL